MGGQLSGPAEQSSEEAYAYEREATRCRTGTSPVDRSTRTEVWSLQTLAMAITCCIRYVLDPFQRDAFETYARNWAAIIPRCGGELLGYFLPHEGTNNIALALITFPGLAAYEAYRARLLDDPDGAANFRFAHERRFILSEERTFLRPVGSPLR